MIRRCFWAVAILCSTGLAAAEPLPADQNVSTSPVCLYESKSYSDGAFICVQKSLMLNCSLDGRRAAWKIVVDRDLSERCVAPITLIYPPAVRRRAHRTHHALHHRVETGGDDSGKKCFVFNSKRYCE
jgi:hypothetical protein